MAEHDIEELEESADPGEERASMGPLIVGGLLFATLAGFVVWLLAGSDSPDLAYSRNVQEVMAEPAAFRGQSLRVEGDLRRHSICFREDPCEWRFVLQGDGYEMPVRFPECVVPDTFRDMPGVSVTVQGQLDQSGFVAREVVAKCPSRYDEKTHQMGDEEPAKRADDAAEAIAGTAVPNPC